MEDARQRAPQSAGGSDAQASVEELHAALDLLSSPPKETFADIGGAPHAPDPTQAEAAQQWQREALQLLQRTQALVCALADEGALPALDHRAASPQQTSGPGEEFSQASGTSFWRDITSVSSSQKSANGSMPHKALDSSAGILAASAPSGAQNRHAGKRSLIEEIHTDRRRQEQGDEPGAMTGLIIEELGDDEAEHAGELSDLIQPGTHALHAVTN